MNFHLCTVHSEIYVVHSPINALLINLVNPLNAELNLIYHLLALLGAHHILHVSSIRFKSVKFTLKYTIISLLHVSVFNDHHQGALSVPNGNYIYVKTLGKITSCVLCAVQNESLILLCKQHKRRSSTCCHITKYI